MKIVKVRDVKTPTRGTDGSAGIDLYIPNMFPIKVEGSGYVPMGESMILDPGKSVLIASGIKANVPIGHALIVMNKSGIAVKHGLLVGACVIDEDYTGEIHIDLKNVTNKPVKLNTGDKITQLVCVPVNYVNISVVDSEEDCFGDKLETTERGAGGFGSTGVK
jgi:dUTP pyrophosphatase